MSEPRTEAGRALLAAMVNVPQQGRRGLAAFIDAIETEARNLGYAEALDEVKAAVDAMPWEYRGIDVVVRVKEAIAKVEADR